MSYETVASAVAAIDPDSDDSWGDWKAVAVAESEDKAVADKDATDATATVAAVAAAAAAAADDDDDDDDMSADHDQWHDEEVESSEETSDSDVDMASSEQNRQQQKSMESMSSIQQAIHQAPWNKQTRKVRKAQLKRAKASAVAVKAVIKAKAMPKPVGKSHEAKAMPTSSKQVGKPKAMSKPMESVTVGKSVGRALQPRPPAYPPPPRLVLAAKSNPGPKHQQESAPSLMPKPGSTSPLPPLPPPPPPTTPLPPPPLPPPSLPYPQMIQNPQRQQLHGMEVEPNAAPTPRVVPPRPKSAMVDDGIFFDEEMEKKAAGISRYIRMMKSATTKANMEAPSPPPIEPPMDPSTASSISQLLGMANVLVAAANTLQEHGQQQNNQPQ